MYMTKAEAVALIYNYKLLLNSGVITQQEHDISVDSLIREYKITDNDM